MLGFHPNLRPTRFCRCGFIRAHKNFDFFVRLQLAAEADTCRTLGTAECAAQGKHVAFSDAFAVPDRKRFLTTLDRGADAVRSARTTAHGCDGAGLRHRSTQGADAADAAVLLAEAAVDIAAESVEV